MNSAEKSLQKCKITGITLTCEDEDEDTDFDDDNSDLSNDFEEE